MSVGKNFAFRMLVLGTLASTASAGSIRTSHSSASSNPTSLVYSANPWTANENLAITGQTSYGSFTLGSATNNGFEGGVVQGTPIALGVQASTGSSGSVNLANGLPNGATSTTTTPSPSPTVSTPAPAPVQADAYINFGTGPYSEASSLTTGTAQSFLNSPAFTQFYKNGASAQDIANFENQVLATIQKTYNDAGLAVHLTIDPHAAAAHSMSVVSGAYNPQSPNAIGITDVGNSGFSFIDKFSGAQSAYQLATAIGHNLSHELMHAFGLANHPEQTGPYVDAATTTLATLSDPSTDFSPAAASLLSTLNFQATGQSISANGAQKLDGDQILVNPSTVPEPSTVALWTLVIGGLVAHRRRRTSARSLHSPVV